MSFAGRFIWRELITPGTDAATAFYGGLFGWTPKAMDMGAAGTYTMLHNDDLDESVGGTMKPMMDGVPSHWLDYISVDDVDESLARVQSLGGNKITDAMDIPVGRFALVSDPNGATFALFKGKDEGATDTERKPPNHTFCWSQLMTRELERTSAFYSELFGWRAEAMGPGMVVFHRGDKMVSSAMLLPPEAGDAPSHWLQYVAVDDTDAAYKKAVSLGAKSWKAPESMPGMGRFAVLSDPNGAMFALWKDLQASA